MVSARQASIDKDAVAKAPPPHTSSKTNPARPPKAPKRTSLKEPISCSSSAQKQMAVAINTMQPMPSLQELTITMEIEHAPPDESSLTAANPSASGAESSQLDAHLEGSKDDSQINTTATATAPSSPPPSPHQQQHQSTLSSQTTPPHHNCSPLLRKTKFISTSISLPPPSLMEQR